MDIVGCGIHVVSDDPSAIELERQSTGAGTIRDTVQHGRKRLSRDTCAAHAAEIIAAKSAGLDAVRSYARRPHLWPSSVQRAVLELLASRARCMNGRDGLNAPFDSVVGVKRVTGAHPSFKLQNKLTPIQRTFRRIPRVSRG